MPAVSEEVWLVLYTVSRYLFPFLALILVILILFYVLSESRIRREKARSLPGFGTVGELIVLSGSRDLEPNTWFPVPREGVLGSVRSCDLVIPCPGVHAKHLDFSWEDGTGLLIRPHTGCEAYVNGTALTCRTKASDAPLTHGSVLQVGSAVLRLHLFAALDNTSAVSVPSSVPDNQQPFPFMQPPLPASFSLPPSVPEPSVQPDEVPVVPAQPVPDTRELCGTPPVLPVQNGPVQNDQEESRLKSAVPRRSDRWQEDFGE